MTGTRCGAFWIGATTLAPPLVPKIYALEICLGTADATMSIIVEMFATKYGDTFMQCLISSGA